MIPATHTDTNVARAPIYSDPDSHLTLFWPLDRRRESCLSNNGGVCMCIDNRKYGTYLCQMKALIAKLAMLEY